MLGTEQQSVPPKLQSKKSQKAKLTSTINLDDKKIKTSVQTIIDKQQATKDKRKEQQQKRHSELNCFTQYNAVANDIWSRRGFSGVQKFDPDTVCECMTIELVKGEQRCHYPGGKGCNRPYKSNDKYFPKDHNWKSTLDDAFCSDIIAEKVCSHRLCILCCNRQFGSHSESLCCTMCSRQMHDVCCVIGNDMVLEGKEGVPNHRQKKGENLPLNALQKYKIPKDMDAYCAACYRDNILYKSDGEEDVYDDEDDEEEDSDDDAS